MIYLIGFETRFCMMKLSTKQPVETIQRFLGAFQGFSEIPQILVVNLQSLQNLTFWSFCWSNTRTNVGSNFCCWKLRTSVNHPKFLARNPPCRDPLQILRSPRFRQRLPGPPQETVWKAVPEHYRRLDRCLTRIGASPLPFDVGDAQCGMGARGVSRSMGVPQ